MERCSVAKCHLHKTLIFSKISAPLNFNYAKCTPFSPRIWVLIFFFFEKWNLKNCKNLKYFVTNEKLLHIFQTEKNNIHSSLSYIFFYHEIFESPCTLCIFIRTFLATPLYSSPPQPKPYYDIRNRGRFVYILNT